MGTEKYTLNLVVGFSWKAEEGMRS